MCSPANVRNEGTVTVGSISPTPPMPSSVTSYSVAKTYDDAQDVLSQTYPTGEVVNTTFTGAGWLGQVTTTQGTTTTTLAANIAYSGNPGAAGKITGMQLGGGMYTYAASYDFAHRLTSLALTRTSDGTVLYQTQPGYDAVGNVTSVLTTLPAGTDNQVFCYDEQERLTWAGSTGTPACGTSLTPGSLTTAQYTQTFGYDTLGRLSSGPLGAYTYGDAAHIHAATAIGATYTATYDAAGDMTCRAPDASKTCAGGSPSGQQLTFDAEGSLKAWQDAPSSPTSTAQYLYDGDGQRVAQQVTTSGATTTTTYIGSVEEVAVSGATTTTTTYYYAADVRVALAVNGVFSYLGDDLLGSASVAFDASGAVQASQLYAPYGGQRYATGTMPGSFGFTGQRSDAVTGLDYYISRYYDPVAGQFTSADTTLTLSGYDPWGLSRYAYVAGNPASKTDPDGHCFPLCTAIAGAVIGGLIGAGVSVATQLHAGNCCDVKKVVAEAAIGAVSGAITGALGPVGGAATTVLVHAVVGGLVGAASQAASNLVEGKPLGDGVLLAAGIGAVTGGISGGIVARQAAKAASAARGAVCLLSFSPDTAVATPDGEQAIGTLQVGDQVTAYDPDTGKSSTQTVEHVWINHDTDLIDLILQVASGSTVQSSADPSGKQQEADIAAHGLRAPPADEQDVLQAQDARHGQSNSVKKAGTESAAATAAATQVLATEGETVHTTYKHPWLTTDRGWVKAGELRLGERVMRLDGTTAVVVAERTVPGAANYYNLEVSQLHTFAVGAGHYVVHNCGAEQLARDIHSAIRGVAGRNAKAFVVAVGEVEENGVTNTVVAINRRAFISEAADAGKVPITMNQAKKVIGQLAPKARFLNPEMTWLKVGQYGPKIHAEEYISQFVLSAPGRTLRAIAPSFRMCSGCRGIVAGMVRAGRAILS